MAWALAASASALARSRYSFELGVDLGCVR